MKKFFLITLFIITGASIVFVYYITRDGEFVTPEGQGTQTLDASSFEAFPYLIMQQRRLVQLIKAILLK